MKKIKHLEIIVKISERCNINCTYCYVFNKSNDLAINSIPIISKSTINNLREFLENLSYSYDVDVIQIDLHGGEPLLIKKERFELICKTLREGDYKNTSLEIACQTNGTLINDEWIELFGKYKVNVSVSLDGPKFINDQARIDKKGQGTYDDAVAGFRLLQLAWENNKLPSNPGILCVANTKIDGSLIYRHFVDDLKCLGFDLLIPDETHDTCIEPLRLWSFYQTAIDEYFNDANENVSIRFFQVIIQGMLNPGRYKVAGLNSVGEDIVAFTMGANGDFYVDDTLRSTNNPIFSKIGNVKNTTLTDILKSWQMEKYVDISNSLPLECESCLWKNLCGGGSCLQKYSKKNGFNNKSVYCHSLKKIYSRFASHLINGGVDEDLIIKNIGGDSV